jgi:F-type H+-transporting ATPase subunit f
MHASLVRRNLSGLVPPKIASPSILVSQPTTTTTTSLLTDSTIPRLTQFPRFLFFLLLLLLKIPHIPNNKSAGKGSDLSPLVAFYSKLPKGPAPEPAVRGIKARYFNGKNASASPIVFTVLALFGLGYTIDYQSEFFGCRPASSTHARRPHLLAFFYYY